MALISIKTLHVDDDPEQQAMLARKLDALEDYQFAIVGASSEKDALMHFREGGFDLIILDFHLTQGDGLSCLRCLRQLDKFVPIIAMSGVASDEIVGNLIQAGADDYLSKRTANREVLGQSVRNVLTRARAFRNRPTTAEQTQTAFIPLGNG